MPFKRPNINVWHDILLLFGFIVFNIKGLAACIIDDKQDYCYIFLCIEIF